MITIEQISALAKTKGALSARVEWIAPFILADGKPSPIIGGFWRCEVLLSPTYFRTVGESRSSKEECLSEALDRVERCFQFAQIDPIALGNALDTLART